MDRKPIAAILAALTLAACTTPTAEGSLRPLTLDAPAQADVHAERVGTPQRVTPAPPNPEPVDPNWLCVQWYPLTIQAGFDHSDWPAIGIIMWRESRCTPTVHYKADPEGGSYGLTQINGYWCRRGGLVLMGWPRGDLCNSMFDPLTNLQAARSIVDYALERNQCRWRQWSTRRGLC